MQLVIKEIIDRKGYVILNRPEKRNALSKELIIQLKDAFEDFIANKEVKVIILKSNGSFCAGADLAYIKEMQDFTYEENLNDSLQLSTLFQLIHTSEKVVIAQVVGHALAGGCGLATICDFAIAESSAVFGFTEVRIGFIPALVSVFLMRKIGEGRAREMLLSGQFYSSQEMLNYGLINRVAEKDDLTKTVDEFANKLIANNASSSMTMTKKLLEQSSGLSLAKALDLAAVANAKARSTEDCKKGLNAFLNKQKIEW